MDNAKIRALLGECFLTCDDPRGQSAEEDYTEAVLALKALKSLFEQELSSRSAVQPVEDWVPHDREM